MTGAPDRAAGRSRSRSAPTRSCIDGAAPAKPDAGVVELADLLHRHLIGGLTLNAGRRHRVLAHAAPAAGPRPPEEVRADGGIAHLWATAGGPSIEIVEIDYAEVLREKQGDAAPPIDQIIAAALAGRAARARRLRRCALLLDIVGDPAKLDD